MPDQDIMISYGFEVIWLIPKADIIQNKDIEEKIVKIKAEIVGVAACNTYKLCQAAASQYLLHNTEIFFPHKGLKGGSPERRNGVKEFR